MGGVLGSRSNSLPGGDDEGAEAGRAFCDVCLFAGDGSPRRAPISKEASELLWRGSFEPYRLVERPTGIRLSMSALMPEARACRQGTCAGQELNGCMPVKSPAVEGDVWGKGLECESRQIASR